MERAGSMEMRFRERVADGFWRLMNLTAYYGY
jgi:hypothetical protein